MKVRGRVALELLTLATLTVTFLLLFPKRSLAVDVILALCALGLVGLNARYTREVIWARFPRGPSSGGLKQCMWATMAITFSAVLVFFIVGIVIGYGNGGWEAVVDRVLNWKLLVAICVYLPWALLQQTLFQFYLLGRLRALFPTVHPIGAATLNGVAYALVHLPDLWITMVTAFGGIFWSYMYNQYRLLLPLALSHAVLGSTFYYWVYGCDLAEAWSELIK